MVFRRILALVALLFAAGACTAGNNATQTAGTVASPRPGSGVPVLPAAVERDVGAAYPDAALQSYVDRVGQKLARGSGLAGPYRFVVLDLPVVNAHALPSGYVFVTRGLLAVLDDEAELAAALGHELGHLTQRHAAQRARARQGVLDAAVEAAAVTGSVTVGRSVARDGLIALRRYSREQELEADRIGLGYLVQAGYRSDAMASLIDRLRQQARLEAHLLDEAPDTFDQRSATSTHPAPFERKDALQTIGVSAAGESGRPAYLAAIDGMSVDDAPDEGFVRGRAFLHPTLKLAFEAPRDFRLFNDQDGVLGVGRDRSLLFFACSGESVPGRLDEWMRNTLKPTPTDIRATEIDGAEAAIGARPRGSDTGLGQARYVMVRHGDRICFFNLLSEGPDRDRRIEVLVDAARSFRTLSDAEAVALRPYRLRVIPVAGASPAQLATRLPYDDFRLERLLVLNGVDTPADLARLSEVKIVQP
ncbi:MAG: M48 family metalloprotease [Reyranella sp.]|nr:M48 family metalloprotease [Reyranella sp.]